MITRVLGTMARFQPPDNFLFHMDYHYLKNNHVDVLVDCVCRVCHDPLWARLHELDDGSWGMVIIRWLFGKSARHYANREEHAFGMPMCQDSHDPGRARLSCPDASLWYRSDLSDGFFGESIGHHWNHPNGIPGKEVHSDGHHSLIEAHQQQRWSPATAAGGPSGMRILAMHEFLWEQELGTACSISLNLARLCMA